MASRASASPFREPSTRASDERFAFGVNEPLGWNDDTIAVSFIVGVAPHQAIRANVAKYGVCGALATDKISAVAGDPNQEVSRRGGFFDVGVGWQWYPRALWSGPVVELGALWRSDSTRRWDDFDVSTTNVIERDATVLAARGLLGWSWLLEDRLFIMAAAGVSLGYAHGTETTRFDDVAQMPATRSVAPVAATLESYLRFGWTF